VFTRQTGYCLRQGEGGGFFGRGFLAWIPVPDLGAQVIRVLEKKDIGESGKGSEKSPQAADDRLDGHPPLAA
jgi:hypothetical protein